MARSPAKSSKPRMRPSELYNSMIVAPVAAVSTLARNAGSVLELNASTPAPGPPGPLVAP